MSDERYQHLFRCQVCATQFTRTRNAAEWTGPRPKCPRKCDGKVKDSYVPDVERTEVQAPAIIGSIGAKAIDTAMTMAMEDHQMTDIRDNARAGEPTAPKLRPDLQQKADSFWGGQQKKQATRTMRADLSPIYGERATAAQSSEPIGTRFKAEAAPAVAPILTHRPEGSSPIPAHRVVAEHR